MENNTHSDDVKVCKSKSCSLGRIFWGCLFVMLGVLLILNNFEIARVNWHNLWRLWPILIIITGLSMLSIRGWFWRVITILTIIISMVLIVWASIFWHGNISFVNNKIVFSNFNIERF